MAGNSRIDRSLLGIVLLVSTVARLVLAGGLDVAPDEAYYWVWSRHLAPGYFDHPPAVAVLIAAGTRALGDTRIGVRILFIACGTLTLYLVHEVSRCYFSRQQALMATVALAVTPAAVAGGVLATPDAPLLLGWALTLRGLAGLDAGRGDGRRSNLVFTSAGVATACLSKLTGFGVLCLVVAWPWLRGQASRTGGGARTEGRFTPWKEGLVPQWDVVIIAVASLSAVTPFVLWSLEHGGLPVTYQWRRVSLAGTPPGVEGALRFILGQTGMIGPVFFWLVLVRWWQMAGRLMAGRVPRRLPRISGRTARVRLAPANRWLFWASAPWFVLFAIASFWTRVEPNWPAPAYLGCAVLVPWEALRARARRAAVITSLLLTLCAAGLLSAPVSWWPSPRPPVARLRGWEQLAEAISDRAGPNTALVVTHRYQEAAEIDFHLAGRRARYRVTALPGWGRPDQYDLFDPPRVLEGEDVLWVTKAGTMSPPPFGGFRRVAGPETVVVADACRRYHLYRLEEARQDMVIRAPPSFSGDPGR